jgi:hypothetical protein
MNPDWEKPELIVLRKGKPEEMVLSHCKAVTVPGLPTNYDGGQYCGNKNTGSCGACSARPTAS